MSHSPKRKTVRQGRLAQPTSVRDRQRRDLKRAIRLERDIPRLTRQLTTATARADVAVRQLASDLAAHYTAAMAAERQADHERMRAGIPAQERTKAAVHAPASPANLDDNTPDDGARESVEARW